MKVWTYVFIATSQPRKVVRAAAACLSSALKAPSGSVREARG